MKMPASLSLALLIAIAAPALAAPPEKPPATAALKALPQGFVGNWEGFCTIVPVETGSSGFRMKLFIKALPERPGYTWIVDYNEFSHLTSEQRKYELLPAPDKDATHFLMDEKTGLMLDSYLIGQTLYSAYYIGGKLYDITYELGADGLTMHGPSYVEEVEQTTCLVGSTTLCAKSLQFAGLQLCHLKRKP